MDPEMMMQAGPPALAPGDEMGGMDAMPEDIDPGEIAAVLGGWVAEQKMMAHQAVDQQAEAAVQQIIAMVMEGAMGAQTLDGMGAAA